MYCEAQGGAGPGGGGVVNEETDAKVSTDVRC